MPCKHTQPILAEAPVSDKEKVSAINLKAILLTPDSSSPWCWIPWRESAPCPTPAPCRKLDVLIQLSFTPRASCTLPLSVWDFLQKQMYLCAITEDEDRVGLWPVRP